MKGWQRVAFVKDFFKPSKKSMLQIKGHICTKKTLLDEVAKLYDCVPRSEVDKFMSLCLVCHLRKPQTTRAPLTETLQETT